MSKSRQSRNAVSKPASAVDHEMLALYRESVRAPTTRENVRRLMLLVDDYDVLITAGDLMRALGAGLDLVDVALRIAATPSDNATEWQYKVGFFNQQFGSMMGSFSHDHVARIADAAVRAEQVVKTQPGHAPGADVAHDLASELGAGANRTTTAVIPQERLTFYANNVSTFGDIESLLTTIHQVCTDKGVLKREGRALEIRGAEHVLANVVRRLCATAAWSEETAGVKTRILHSAKRLYQEGEGGLLMAAMIDAAVGIETENWLAASTRH